MEPQQVPKASDIVITGSVERAIENGDLWLVSGPTSLWKESVPAGVLTDSSSLLSPPNPILAAAILESNLEAAWQDGKATVAGIRSQLSVQYGKPLPWVLVREAVDGALRARLIELDSNSGAWPCDSSCANKTILKAVAGAGSSAAGGGLGGGSVLNDNGFSLRAYLKPNELQDLADSLSDLMAVQSKHGLALRFHLSVEAATDGELKDDIKAQLRKILGDVSDAFH